MIELAQLRLFVGVAEDLHFSRAAARLFITQPALSRRIRALETSLGIELFSRGHRRVNLTPAGRELLARARAILADTVAAEHAARSASREVVRPLSIAFAPAATLSVMPRMLHLLRARAGDVQCSVRGASAASQFDAVRRGTIDVGVVDQSTDDIDIACRPFARERLLLALPVRHPRASGRVATAPAASQSASRLDRAPRDSLPVVEMHSLALESFILFPRLSACGVVDAVVSACQRAGFEPHIAHEAPSPLDALTMVASELGVTIVPMPMSPMWPSAIAWASLGERAPCVEFSVLWRRDNEHPALRCFEEAIDAACAASEGAHTRAVTFIA